AGEAGSEAAPTGYAVKVDHSFAVGQSEVVGPAELGAPREEAVQRQLPGGEVERRRDRGAFADHRELARRRLTGRQCTGRRLRMTHRGRADGLTGPPASRCRTRNART